MSFIIGPDVSFYQDDDTTTRKIDFSMMVAAGAKFVIVRAGQNTWKDGDFQYNWAESKKVGLARGSYWYYDSRNSPEEQARIYAEQLGDDPGELPIWVDIEEKYGGDYSDPKNWKLFIEALRGYYPDHEIGIYTAYYYWLDNCPTSDYDYYSQLPLWVANYDATRPLCPRPWGDGNWLFWQFTEMGNGKAYGAESNAIDLNYFNGDEHAFNLRFNLGGTIPTPEEEYVEFHFDDKVKYSKGHKELPRPFNYHVTRFKRSDVERVHVNGLGFLGRGTYFWKTRGNPDIVVNGGHANYSVGSPIPFSIVVSDGKIEKTQPTEDSIQFNKDHQPIGMFWFAQEGCYNAVGISSWLIRDGVINQNANNVYVDPRNAIFWNDDEYLLVTIDGRNDGTQGLTLLELAKFALQLGAKNGGNCDGGDSNTLILTEKGQPIVKNNPPDNELHSVANHVGFWISRDTTPPDNGEPPMAEKYYKCPDDVHVPFARYVSDTVKGVDGSLQFGQTFPESALIMTVFQNNKFYYIFQFVQLGVTPFSGSIEKPENAIEEKYLTLVDPNTVPPDPPEPPAQDEIPYETTINIKFVAPDGKTYEDTQRIYGTAKEVIA